MKLFVTVKPRAKIEKVEKISEDRYAVSVKEPATENKANFAVLEALADHLGVPFSQLRLVHGRTSREKVIEVL